MELAKSRSYYLAAPEATRAKVLGNLDWYLHGHLGHTPGGILRLPYLTQTWRAFRGLTVTPPALHAAPDGPIVSVCLIFIARQPKLCPAGRSVRDHRVDADAPKSRELAVLEATGREPRPMDAPGRKKRGQRRALLGLLGPAFVASIAYVDPGNVAANLTAGAQYGYLLVWVLVAANVMAVLVQYQSAKLGIVTGKTPPGDPRRAARDRPGGAPSGSRPRSSPPPPTWPRSSAARSRCTCSSACPLPLGAVIVGGISMVLLAVQSRNRQRPFEFVIIFLLGIITVGFLAGLFISPPDPAGGPGRAGARLPGPGHRAAGRRACSVPP